MNFRILYEFLEIFIEKEKMKKGKPWNSTGCFRPKATAYVGWRPTAGCRPKSHTTQ
jgi:hypothetical protein